MRRAKNVSKRLGTKLLAPFRVRHRTSKGRLCPFRTHFRSGRQSPIITHFVRVSSAPFSVCQIKCRTLYYYYYYIVQMRLANQPTIIRGQKHNYQVTHQLRVPLPLPTALWAWSMSEEFVFEQLIEEKTTSTKKDVKINFGICMKTKTASRGVNPSTERMNFSRTSQKYCDRFNAVD